MRINVKRRSRLLETISQGDILVFKDREEIVNGVDIDIRKLFTKKNIKSKNFNGEEYIEYNNIERIYPGSKGETYDWRRAA